jgi:glycosyltransferase family protein
MLNKIKKELERFSKRLFYPGKDKQLEVFQYRLDNLPYEMYDKITKGDFYLQIPIIKTAEETLNKILQNGCSLARFGDGEFDMMNGDRIHFQNPSPELAGRLREVVASNIPNLLIGLPDRFGSLDHYIPPVIDFWRKWMSRKREMAYSYLDMNRVYYSAFFSRAYISFIKTDMHYQSCSRYFEKIKKIWTGRDVVICEGERTRFGMFNDLLTGAKSISRILCPARNAFDKYDAILSAFDGVSTESLVLVSLGPTATVLAYDLCKKGYQSLDIGAIDVDYEWFLRKEVVLGAPVKFKYVDSGNEGRKEQPLDDPEYKRQIIKRIG